MHTPKDMNALLAWYRFQSGEYSAAEMRGLASRLDVRVPTPPREEYDAEWIVDESMRRQWGGGVDDDDDDENAGCMVVWKGEVGQ